MDFKEMILAIYDALVEVEESNATADVRSTARAFRKAIADTNFMIHLSCVASVLRFTHSLSVALQAEQMDLVSCVREVGLLKTKLEATRKEEAERHVEEILCYVKGKASELGYAMIRRGSPPEETESHFKKVIHDEFTTMVENVIDALELQFSEAQQATFSLQKLLPNKIVDEDYEAVVPAINKYSDDLDVSGGCMEVELGMWKAHCSMIPKSERPDNPVAALNLMKSAHILSMYPGVANLLKILAVLPVTTASVERSFSRLRLLKTFLRNRTSENRLTGLALMMMHKEIAMEIYPDAVIDKYAED